MGLGYRKTDGRPPVRVARRAIVGVAVAVPLALAAACSSGGGSGQAAAGSHPGGGTAKLAEAAPATVTATPAAGATSVDPSVPVKVNVGGGKVQAVTLTTAAGATVPGTVAAGGVSWTAATHLALSTAYTLKVTATNGAGKTTQKTESFTTMAAPQKLTIQQYMPNDGDVVGVGQPVTVNFTNYVPTAYRAAVERSMTVTTTPAVAGAWSWVSETQADWRPSRSGRPVRRSTSSST